MNTIAHTQPLNLHRVAARPVANPSSGAAPAFPLIGGTASARTATAPPAKPAPTTVQPLSDFQRLFLYGSAGTPVTTPNTTQPIPITPFNATYETGATVSGPGPVPVQKLNPIEYATADTAQQLAAMLGGKVIEEELGGAWKNSVPMREIAFPDGRKLNAGLTAQLFAQYGTQTGGYAWQAVATQLGRPSNYVWPSTQGGSAA